MAQQNTYQLTTPYLDIEPRDLTVDSALSLPPSQSATALLAGEWLTVNASGLGVRAHTVNDPVEEMAYAAFFDPGDYSVQALSHVPVLFAHGTYEVETTMLQDGVSGYNFAIGGKVAVGQVDVGDGVARSGLIPWDALMTLTVRIFGYVTKLGTFDGSGFPTSSTRVMITAG